MPVCIETPNEKSVSIGIRLERLQENSFIKGNDGNGDNEEEKTEKKKKKKTKGNTNDRKKQNENDSLVCLAALLLPLDVTECRRTRREKRERKRRRDWNKCIRLNSKCCICCFDAFVTLASITVRRSPSHSLMLTPLTTQHIRTLNFRITIKTTSSLFYWRLESAFLCYSFIRRLFGRSMHSVSVVDACQYLIILFLCGNLIERQLFFWVLCILFIWWYLSRCAILHSMLTHTDTHAYGLIALCRFTFACALQCAVYKRQTQSIRMRWRWRWLHWFIMNGIAVCAIGWLSQGSLLHTQRCQNEFFDWYVVPSNRSI